jgi:hypothetical protein
MTMKQVQFYEEAIARAPVLCCHSMNLNVVPVKLIVLMNLLQVCFACLTCAPHFKITGSGPRNMEFTHNVGYYRLWK